jgi:prepilin-type N-terminal cleavage/methylation domain-containing protein
MSLTRRQRRGFSLLEVMLALMILTISLLILAEAQATAVVATQEAERVIVATDLAQLKLSEAMLKLEQEGFQNSQVVEFGEFDDLGDELTNLEFGRELEDYHWEYTITEIDIQLAGDMASMMGEGGLGGGALGGIFPGMDEGAASGGGMPDGAASALGAAGMNPQMLTEMVGPYIRMVVVRVWWGEDSEEASEQGTEVILATHVANPAGMLSNPQMPPGMPQ